MVSVFGFLMASVVAGKVSLWFLPSQENLKLWLSALSGTLNPDSQASPGKHAVLGFLMVSVVAGNISLSLVSLWFPSSQEMFPYGFRPWFPYGFRAATAPPVITDGNYKEAAWTFPRTTKYYIYIHTYNI